MAILTHPGHSVENNSMSRQQKQMHETKPERTRSSCKLAYAPRLLPNNDSPRKQQADPKRIQA